MIRFGKYEGQWTEKTNADPTDTIDYVESGYLTRAVQSLLMVVPHWSPRTS